MKPVILIVDDEEANRDILARYLKRWGYLVQSAPSGTAALEFLASESHVDLVLLDLLMPGMDGFEVLERIKEDPVLNTIPVLILTAVRDSKTMIRGLESGAADYVAKPFQELELKARVRAQVRGREGVLDKARNEKVLALSKLTLGILGEIRRIHDLVENEMGVFDGEEVDLDAVRTAGHRIRTSMGVLPSLLESLSDTVLASVEKRQNLDYPRLIDRVRSLATFGWSSRDLALEWEFPEDLPMVLVQFHQLSQILVGILQGAAAASPDGSVLRWTATDDGSHLVFEIRAPRPDTASVQPAGRGYPGLTSSDAIQNVLEGHRGAYETRMEGETVVHRLSLATSQVRGEAPVTPEEGELSGSTRDTEPEAEVPEFVVETGE